MEHRKMGECRGGRRAGHSNNMTRSYVCGLTGRRGREERGGRTVRPSVVVVVVRL